MTFPSVQTLNTLQENDFTLLCDLDSRGLFIAPGETFEDYRNRLIQQGNGYRNLIRNARQGKELSGASGFPIGNGFPVSPRILQESAAITEKLYGFTISWVPAYFLSKGLSFLWGGCTILTDQGLSLFVIRKNFAGKKHWFLYDRDELLAHELCHVARNVFENCELEEHFAYATAKSALRRYSGNCFRTELDALFFLLPVLLLLTVEFLVCFGVFQIPLWPFTLLVLLYPAFLLIRNQRSRNWYFRAEKNVKTISCSNPSALLFRCTMDEIKTIACLSGEDLRLWINKKKQTELRWQIITMRFL